ncbi:unnamed protein product [Blepharisma stoltei]|uniref:EF-hand domain-containing protein n=1 Tax=Blepharisma stoltei TaxID=1481888 RepID=A0AAU9KC51_9CILI|nr:unnamed protein product [Blepharisma stoltei]
MALTSMSANSLKEIKFNLQMQLKNKGQNSTKALRKKFVQYDLDKNTSLDREEFEQFLTSSGLFLSRMDVNYLMRHFDKNKDGTLSLSEFIDGIVPELNSRRLNIVQQVWEKLDRNGSNSITLDFLYNSYNVRNHPDVASGRKTEEEIISKFLDAFDASEKGPNGIITQQEFFFTYRDISSSYPHDDEAFVSMMECVWNIGEQHQVNAGDLATVETMLKDKVRLRMIGNETEEQALLRVFKFVDIDDNGYLTRNEFHEALARIGVNLSPELLNAFFQKYDIDRSNSIDYLEFCRSIGNIESHIFTQSISHSFHS